MRPVPTRRTALVAVALAVVVLALPGDGVLVPLLVVNAALLVLVAVDVALAVDPRQLDVERDLPPVLVLRGSGEVTWRLRNPTARTVRVALADDLAPSLGASTRRWRGTVPGGAMLRTSATLHPSRRGRFEVPGVVARVD